MGKKRAAATGDQTSPLHEQLAEVVHEHSLFFNQLVELIPARFFLPYSSDDSPWFPGLSNKEKAKFKEQTRDNILKSRRDRLDPSRPASSTLDLLNKSLEEAKQHSLSSDDDDDEEEEDEDEHIEEEEEEDDDDEKGVEKSKALVTDQRPVTYEELQRRLRQRIADLAAGRNTRPEAHLKQERKKNNKKLKVKTKKNREKNKDNDTAAAASTSTTGNTTGKRKREDGEFSKKKSKVAKPAADITFGQVTIDGKEKKNRKKRLPKEKELERAKRLQEVKKEDPEKGKKVSWKAAVSKAAGEKVHDDPRLLKESIKKEKKRQVKSKDKWREREETVAKAKADKQSKRAGNIKDRIQQNKMRKIEKREKKLMRPGFEGRKL